MTTPEKPARKPIVHKPVENSGQISSYGYHPESQTVGIVYKTGQLHEYQYPCNPQLFAGFEAAKSKGAYARQHFFSIKDFQKFDPLPVPVAASDEPTPATAAELEAAGQERLVG